MKKLVYLLTTLLLAAAPLAFSGCGQPQAKESPTADAAPIRTVRIAYLPITHALPLFAAHELETPDGPVHIELIKYGSWPELMDALNTGKVDGASVLIELGVKAREQGIDLRAAALGHKDGNVIITNPSIENITDLKGTTFAIPHKQSSHKLLLDQLLASAGMTEADLKVVELSPPEMPAALAQGQIAGYCVAEPFGAKSVMLGTGKVFARSDELWQDSLCCALVFNGTFLDQHHELAQAFTQQYKKAGQYLTANPEEARRIAAKYLKAKDTVLALSMQWISYDDLTIQEDAYHELLRRMKDANLIQSEPAYEDFVDRSLLDENDTTTAANHL